MEPVWTAVFGFWLAGDRLGAVGWTGAALIMAGIVVAEPAAARRAAQAVPQVTARRPRARVRGALRSDDGRGPSRRAPDERRAARRRGDRARRVGRRAPRHAVRLRRARPARPRRLRARRPLRTRRVAAPLHARGPRCRSCARIGRRRRRTADHGRPRAARARRAVRARTAPRRRVDRRRRLRARVGSVFGPRASGRSGWSGRSVARSSSRAATPSSAGSPARRPSLRPPAQRRRSSAAPSCSRSSRGARRWRRGKVFVPAGICFGLSYVCLFEAYFRGRVTVVSPLVATESLWGVALSALLIGRSELVGRRLVLGVAPDRRRRRPDRQRQLAAVREVVHEHERGADERDADQPADARRRSRSAGSRRSARRP